VKNHPVNIERLLQRAADAKAAVQLSDVLSFFLIATPAEPVKLNGLFSTKSAEYKAIVEPPAYCQQEFDVNPHNPLQHVHGELVGRVARGRKGLELWQDGTLIFVGRNDEDFLGWAVRPTAGDNNIYTNNYVLTEVVSRFLTAAIQIFGERQDPPEKIKICFGLTRQEVDVANKGTTYELSAHPINQFGSYPGRKAPPAEDRTFWIDFTLKDAVPEVEALKFLKEIYHWFGITDEQIPNVDSTSVPERVDRARATPDRSRIVCHRAGLAAATDGTFDTPSATQNEARYRTGRSK
jgi:hypothetical protein